VIKTHLPVCANEERLVVPQHSHEDRPHGRVHQRDVEMLPTQRSQQSQERSGHMRELLLGAGATNHKDGLMEVKSGEGRAWEPLRASAPSR
jgi:hypothetical protein